MIALATRAWLAAFPWTRSGALRASDRFVAAWSLLFASWVVFGWGGDRLEPLIDLALFGVMSVMTGVMQLRVGARVVERRERIAWHLLAAATLARTVSGSIWGLLVELGAADSGPPWMVGLVSAYLAFSIAALLIFPSEQWKAIDRTRFRLDAATVLIGSLLVVWFFAIGPYLRSPDMASAPLKDQLYTIGDSITVVLAAALYLRSGSAATRAAAVFLLVAFTLQMIPDIGFWQSGWAATYSPGDGIAAIWFGAWLSKWLAARSADHELSHPPELTGQETPGYRSGAIPYAFLVAATALLLGKLVTGATEDRALFAVGSAVLAALLVVRQGVELRERDRLHEALKTEESRYRALLQHAYDAVVLLGEDGRVRYASPATERTFGAVVGLATELAIDDIVHPADRAAVRAAFAEASTGPRTVTMRVRDVAQEWRVFEGYVQDRRSDPLIGGYVLNGLDRTRELRLAHGLRDAQRFEALGVLASGLAHDLNNILTVIASHAEMLHDDEQLRPQARVDLRAIRSASDRAQALTHGLLTLSRRKGATWTTVVVDALVRERIAGHGGGFVQDPAMRASGAAVRADGEALGHVIDAVLDETAAAGTGALTTVRIHERDLDAASAHALRLEAGPYVVIAVGDGVGCPPQEVVDAVRTADDGEWDLAPGDLAMLMALASAREVGGTLVRERTGAAQRLAIYLPSVAA